MTDASTRLSVSFVAFAAGSTLIDAISVPWCSLGLEGERHTVRLDADEAATALAHDLPDYEFAFPGLLVADVAVTATNRTSGGTILTIEALTLDEPVSPAPKPG